jgi:hypothetical protein
LKDNKRFLRLRAFSDSASHGMRLYFLSKVDLVSLNERLVLKDDKSQIQFVQFMAPSSKGITLELTTEATKPFEVRVIEQRMGLPAAAMVAPLPESFIYAPNYFSNSTHIKYQVKL